MKDFLDMLEAALPENEWLRSWIQDKARGFTDGSFDGGQQFKSRGAAQKGRGEKRDPLEDDKFVYKNWVRKKETQPLMMRVD